MSTSLPELPKQKKNKEANFGVQFRKWLKDNPQYSSAFELKQTNSNSIPFKALEDEQAAYLSSITSDKGTLVRVLGMAGEPDYIYLRNTPAYVVVKFPRGFHIISIGTWLLERSRSKRKSLTSARAREISVISVVPTR